MPYNCNHISRRLLNTSRLYCSHVNTSHPHTDCKTEQYLAVFSGQAVDRDPPADPNSPADPNPPGGRNTNGRSLVQIWRMPYIGYQYRKYVVFQIAYNDMCYVIM